MAVMADSFLHSATCFDTNVKSLVLHRNPHVQNVGRNLQGLRLGTGTWHTKSANRDETLEEFLLLLYKYSQD